MKFSRLSPALAAGAVCACVFACACGSNKDHVMARVGKLDITQSDFHRKLTEVASEYQNYLLTPNGRKQFLDILVREKLILAAAKDSSVSGSRKYKDEIAKMQEEFDSRMKDYKDYLLTKMWLDDLKEKGVMQVSEDEIREHHKKHPYEIYLDHIVVSTPEEAETIMRKVRSGASFQNTARTLSLDADTASRGGRLPPFLYGEFLPDLEDVAFKMRVGEIQGVVKSKFGYHVLRKNGEKPLSYEEAKERISKLLKKKKLDEYLETLQSKYKVEVLDDQYKQ